MQETPLSTYGQGPSLIEWLKDNKLTVIAATGVTAIGALIGLYAMMV